MVTGNYKISEIHLGEEDVESEKFRGIAPFYSSLHYGGPPKTPQDLSSEGGKDSPVSLSAK